jgi:hypothetical protein
MITKEFATDACKSVQDPLALNIMKKLGGYTKILERCTDRILRNIAENPRTASFLQNASTFLRAQTPELRVRTQAMLSRLRLSPSGSVGALSGGSQNRQPLSFGAYSELNLQAPTLGWKGKADLLVLSQDACEIIDFKTGARNDKHSFQIQVYALLWSRDDELNPSRRLADRLVLAYNGGDVVVASPSTQQLDDLERDIVARTRAAIHLVAQRPPEARPSAKNCHNCDFRQLCDEYWIPETQRNLADASEKRRSMDLEVTINRRHGPSSWDVTVNLCSCPIASESAVLRTAQDLAFRSGDKLRLLDATVAVDTEGNGQLPFITLGAFSEAFMVP